MATITLQIVNPEHDQAFAGKTPQEVQFKGELTTLPPELASVPLYFRWYSSLNSQVHVKQGDKKARYSLNADALPSADKVHTETLALGSHVIAFAASDRAGETKDDFQDIRHGAATGGHQGASRCVIHVFSANMLDLPGSVTRADLVLRAEAPWAWGNDDYHGDGYNQLQYRWTLAPAGQPTGRPVLEFKPSRIDLVFTAATNSQPPQVAFTPALPPAAVGAYTVTLSVEDKEKPVDGRRDTATAHVVLLP